MKKLYILRHAKAERITPVDFERVLHEKGKDQVISIANQFLESSLIAPQRIICSSANRTRETCDRFLETTKFEVPVDYREDLYLTDAQKIISAIEKIGEKADHLMVVGHNPGIEHAASMLVGKFQSMGTGYLVETSWDIPSWAEIQATAPTKWNLMTP